MGTETDRYPGITQKRKIMMDRRQFIKTSGLIAGHAMVGSVAGFSNHIKNPPNILMITCHDLGQHLGCYGVREVSSPNIDKLAAKGVRFENMFSTSAVCSPARGALHTGRYPQRNGLMGLTHGPWWWRFHEGEKHTAAILQANGYQSYLCGLQHIFERGQADQYGYQHILTEKSNAENTVKIASQFLQQRREPNQPFFLKVGFSEVHRKGSSFKHRPYDPDKPINIPAYLADTSVMREDLGRYQEDIRFFDSCVGHILDALKTSACANNTLVIFTSDHGIPYPGAKWTLRDAGIEVPLILYQPDSTLSGGKVQKELISHVDVLPTLLDWIGINKPANLDGVSFADFLNGRSTTKPRKAVYAQFTPAMFRDNESRCIRTKKFKLIRFFSAGRCVHYPIDVDPQQFALHTERAKNNWSPRPFVQLFDIQNDPDELNDIADKKVNASIVKELSQKLYVWMTSVDDPLLKGPVRSPYYQKSMEAFKATAQTDDGNG